MSEGLANSRHLPGQATPARHGSNRGTARAVHRAWRAALPAGGINPVATQLVRSARRRGRLAWPGLVAIGDSAANCAAMETGEVI